MHPFYSITKPFADPVLGPEGGIKNQLRFGGRL